MRNYGPTLERAAELGLSWDTFYVRGRAGVLGGAPLPSVVAALAFFAPEYVERNWHMSWREGDPSVTAAEFARSLHHWAVEEMPRSEAAEVAGLLDPAVRAAEPWAMPLFAAWKGQPRPSDPRALAAHLIFLLREHRGGCHVIALAAHGIDPLAAVVSNNTEATARRFGWQIDLPDPVDSELLTAVEQLTNEMASRPYRSLTGAQRSRLGELMTHLEATVGAA